MDKNWKRGSQIAGCLGQECPWQRQKLEQRSLTVGQWGHILRFPGEVKRERVWLTNYRHNEGPDSPGTLQRLLTSFLVRQGPLQGLEHRPGLVLPTF